MDPLEDGDLEGKGRVDCTGRSRLVWIPNARSPSFTAAELIALPCQTVELESLLQIPALRFRFRSEAGLTQPSTDDTAGPPTGTC